MKKAHRPPSFYKYQAEHPPVTTHIPLDLKEKIEKLVKNDGSSVSTWIRDIIITAFDPDYQKKILGAVAIEQLFENERAKLKKREAEIEEKAKKDREEFAKEMEKRQADFYQRAEEKNKELKEYYNSIYNEGYKKANAEKYEEIKEIREKNQQERNKEREERRVKEDKFKIETEAAQKKIEEREKKINELTGTNKTLTKTIERQEKEYKAEMENKIKVREQELEKQFKQRESAICEEANRKIAAAYKQGETEGYKVGSYKLETEKGIFGRKR